MYLSEKKSKAARLLVCVITSIILFSATMLQTTRVNALDITPTLDGFFYIETQLSTFGQEFVMDAINNPSWDSEPHLQRRASHLENQKWEFHLVDGYTDVYTIQNNNGEYLEAWFDRTQAPGQIRSPYRLGFVNHDISNPVDESDYFVLKHLSGSSYQIYSDFFGTRTYIDVTGGQLASGTAIQLQTQSDHVLAQTWWIYQWN